MDTPADKNMGGISYMLPSVAIAPDGDVEFLVGDEQRRLRVHSLFLRTVSSVFNAMLGPRYSEGANLSSGQPKTIPLPEDDPDAMEIIFNIIHFRMDDVGEHPDPKVVLDLAIAADKYDLTTALRRHIRDWLECESTQDPKSLWQLSRAAFVLRNDKAFEAATLNLLCHYGGSYLRLENIDAVPIGIEGRFAVMLEERRGRLRLEVVCLAIRRHTKGKLSLSSGRRLDPAEVSRTSLYAAIRSLLAPPPMISGWEERPGSPTSENDIIKTTIAGFVDQGLGGLCLTCVHTGEEHQSHSN